uniref:Uncharacterized protein n=1 Tax=Aegilops tauschii subsp. strangulata TaxID=200361 RepID=A0A453LJ96_AEGTS
YFCHSSRFYWSLAEEAQVAWELRRRGHNSGAKLGGGTIGGVLGGSASWNSNASSYHQPAVSPTKR